jgi:hypothetical protein
VSAIDVAKSLHRRAIDLVCGHRIVFHHVPKCGGTSVGRSLRRAYLLSQGTVTPVESEKAFNAATSSHSGNGIAHVSELREMMLLYMLYSDVRCVSSHIPFSNAAYERFAERYAFVTLLRDPVDRFISNYYWNHNRLDAHFRIAETLDAFLSSERARGMGSTYVRYFCGQPAQQFTRSHVEAAITNLRRMDGVGFLDDVLHFQTVLRSLTGKRLAIGTENVGNTTARRDEILSGPLRDRILEICAPDRAIWDAVQDLRKQQPSRVRSRKQTLNAIGGGSLSYGLSKKVGTKSDVMASTTSISSFVSNSRQ